MKINNIVDVLKYVYSLGFIAGQKSEFQDGSEYDIQRNIDLKNGWIEYKKVMKSKLIEDKKIVDKYDEIKAPKYDEVIEEIELKFMGTIGVIIIILFFTVITLWCI